jgi:hypothetical protein
VIGIPFVYYWGAWHGGRGEARVDPVAPVIHEWTYEALVYDLLSLDDNIIR